MAKINTTRVTMVAAICLLSGCASTHELAERHPVFAGVAVAIVAGSIVAAASNHGHSAPVPHCHQQPTPLNCRPVM